MGGALAALFYKGSGQSDERSEAFRRESISSAKRPPLIEIFMPLIGIFAGVIAPFPLDKAREKIRIKLLQAGSPGSLSPDEFMGCRVLALIIGAAAGLFIDTEVDLFPITTMGLSVLGFFYPNIYVDGMIQKRRRRIFRDMPDFLDTLRLAVDAGLDLSSALAVCVEKGRQGPLLLELEKVERDIRLGRTRKEAFRAFADRLQMTEINSFVIALIQADQLGASIGPVLKIQAEVARTRRWQAAEVLVNKMPMKMLAPLVMLIFPASFIILFTPLLIQYMQGTN
jgi:tight adherence protein C